MWIDLLWDFSKEIKVWKQGWKCIMPRVRSGNPGDNSRVNIFPKGCIYSFYFQVLSVLLPELWLLDALLANLCIVGHVLGLGLGFAMCFCLFPCALAPAPHLISINYPYCYLLFLVVFHQWSVFSVYCPCIYILCLHPFFVRLWTYVSEPVRAVCYLFIRILYVFTSTCFCLPCWIVCPVDGWLWPGLLFVWYSACWFRSLLNKYFDSSSGLRLDLPAKPDRFFIPVLLTSQSEVSSDVQLHLLDK